MKRIFIHPYAYPGIPVYHGTLFGTPQYETKDLLRVICEYYGVLEIHIFGKSRQLDIISARHSYCYMLKHKFKWHDGKIAKHINRDRTSVLVANQRFFDKRIHVKRNTKIDLIRIEKLLDRETNKRISLAKSTFI